MKELIFEATLPDCLAYPDWVEDIIQKWQEEAVSFVDQRIQFPSDYSPHPPRAFPPFSTEMIHEIFDSSLPQANLVQRGFYDGWEAGQWR